MKRRPTARSIFFGIAVAAASAQTLLFERHAAAASLPPSIVETVRGCLNSLPPRGGTCEVGGEDGRVIDGPIVLSHSGTTLRFGPGTTVFRGTGQIAVEGDFISVEAFNGSTLVSNGTLPVVRIGSAAKPVRRWIVEGLRVLKGIGGVAPSGIALINAREGELHRVQIEGFSGTNGAGIAVGRDCWAVRADNVYVTGNLCGYHFRGANLNAWVIQGGYINKNRAGICFDLGPERAQGIVVTGGTIIENNTKGVLVRSGVIDSLALVDVYAETFEGQTAVEVEPTGVAPVVVVPLEIRGGFFYSRNEPSFRFSTRDASGDAVVATISSVHQRVSSDIPMAVFEGSATRGALKGVTRTHSRGLPLSSSTLLQNIKGARGTVDAP